MAENPFSIFPLRRPETAARERERMPVGMRSLEDAKKVIQERFEAGPEEDELSYHVTGHTEGVVRRISKLAKALALTEHESLLAAIAGAWHDSVQKWDPEGEGIDKKRVRRKGQNERASADEAIAWMKAQIDQRFSEADYMRVEAAILATVPEWDNENGTVYQKALVPGADPVLWALALADLGSNGMEPDLSVLESDQLFAEDNLGLMEMLRAAKTPSDITEAAQRTCVARYRDFMRREDGFARGRQTRLTSELASLPAGIRKQVSKLFGKLPETIRLKERKAKEAETLTFEQIALRLLPHAFSEVS